MTTKTIILGNGHRITVASYVKVWRMLKKEPLGRLCKHSLTGWGVVTVEEFLAQYSAVKDARINRHIPGYGKGRKWQDQWQADARQTANLVNSKGLRVSWIPPDLRARLANRTA